MSKATLFDWWSLEYTIINKKKVLGLNILSRQPNTSLQLKKKTTTKKQMWFKKINQNPNLLFFAKAPSVCWSLRVYNITCGTVRLYLSPVCCVELHAPVRHGIKTRKSSLSSRLAAQRLIKCRNHTLQSFLNSRKLSWRHISSSVVKITK